MNENSFLKVRLTTSYNKTADGINNTYTFTNIPTEVLDEPNKVTVGGKKLLSTQYTYNSSTKILYLNETPKSGDIIVLYFYKWVPIPVLKGEDGKSAYESAVENGFNGTEQQFNIALASILNKQNRIDVSGILKGQGNGNITNAVAGTDYVLPSGNVASADKLKTARNITIGSKANSFNGESNINFSLSDIGAAEAEHVHKASDIGSSGNADVDNTFAYRMMASAAGQSNLVKGQIRNITIGTTDLTSASVLPAGTIYIYYVNNN